MHDVAGGLAAIHAMGILHRDLSPSNIMVADNGIAKILDLGLSRDAAVTSTDVTRAGYLVGTLRYVSPEHVDGRECGFPSEVFSFGVILYEALSGTHPFSAEHDMSLLYNISQRDASPVRTRMSACPARLDRLLATCLAKSPEDRLQSMALVERELEEIMRLSDWTSTETLQIAAPMPGHVAPQNPYGNRVMIRRREDFFGRAQEVRRIFARLNATPPGSMSIVGERKIGKSSLMNHVYARSVRQRNLEQSEKTVMVFLDFQQAKQMSVESFVRELLGIANIELRGRLDVSDCALSLDGIKDLVQRLEADGFRLTILLDEFEAVTANPNFNLEFFAFLRFLANHYNVSYITSSARDLQVLCHDKEISDSPFFNIFSTVRLSVFDRKEAEELIRKPSEAACKPLGAHVESILDMAGLFPFFIQMACSHAIDYLNDHPDAGAPDFREVRRRFYEEAKLHYRYIWEGLDTHEKSTMLRVARGKSMPDALKHVLEELESRHYVEPAGGRPRLFASTFDEFVRKESRDGGTSLLGRLFGMKSG